MNVGRLVGAIVCLALAVVLGALSLYLPSDQMVFTVGDQNLPWLPAVVLGVIGLLMLPGALGSQPGPATEVDEGRAAFDPKNATLNKRLETVAWGCFLIMLGGFLLVPRTVVAGGMWSMGVGAILLGLNVARYSAGIRMSGFTTFLGVVSILGGAAEVLGLTGAEGAFFLVVLGSYLLLKPWFDRRRLFGKAEEVRSAEDEVGTSPSPR